MDHEDFLRALQDRTAQVAIGPSTLRNTGASGVVEAARTALMGVELARFVAPSQEGFANELDRVTLSIRRRFPRPADRWGNARKALNIFLREVLYSAYLARELHFRRVERWLELPLDSYTVRALRREEAGAELPRWPGVAKVDPRTYAEYQAAAKQVASDWGIARVHLDIFWWRAK